MKKFDEANKYFDLAIKADAKFSLAYENALRIHTTKRYPFQH